MIYILVNKRSSRRLVRSVYTHWCRHSSKFDIVWMVTATMKGRMVMEPILLINIVTMLNLNFSMWYSRGTYIQESSCKWWIFSPSRCSKLHFRNPRKSCRIAYSKVQLRRPLLGLGHLCKLFDQCHCSVRMFCLFLCQVCVTIRIVFHFRPQFLRCYTTHKRTNEQWVQTWIWVKLARRHHIPDSGPASLPLYPAVVSARPSMHWINYWCPKNQNKNAKLIKCFENVWLFGMTAISRWVYFTNSLFNLRFENQV